MELGNVAILPSYKEGSGGSKKLNDLPMVTQEASGGARKQSRVCLDAKSMLFLSFHPNPSRRPGF